MAEQAYPEQNGATPELEELDALVGSWETRGRVMAGEELEIVGTDDYEWWPGGFFLVHRVDVTIGGERVRTLEVIGYDPDTRRYPTRFFDQHGNTGTYLATVEDGVWTFTTEGARASLAIDPSGDRMRAVWERSIDDGGWERWMVLEFTRRGRSGHPG